MKQLKAKMKVGSVVDYGNQNVEANLTAVTGTSEENKTYSMYTPRADMKIHITNPDALNFFKAGKEYVLTFQEVETEETAKEKLERYRNEGVMFSPPEPEHNI